MFLSMNTYVGTWYNPGYHGSLPKEGTFKLRFQGKEIGKVVRVAWGWGGKEENIQSRANTFWDWWKSGPISQEEELLSSWARS